MVEKTQRRIGEVSHLPFSRAEGARLRGQAEVDGIRPTHLAEWALPSQKPEIHVALTPMDYHPDDPASIRLRQWVGNTILTWPIKLPDTDPRGVLSANLFECWKKACDSRVGVAGYYYSLKGRGQVACHSRLEARLLQYFEMCPLVVEIRTQYPQWNREEFREYVLSGSQHAEPRLRTIDFMLTLAIPGIPYLVYHGVSGKPFEQLGDATVMSRHEKEAKGLWEWGGTHEVMTDKTVSEREAKNYERILAALQHTEPDEIDELAAPAALFARKLMKSNAQGPMDRVVGMVGRRMGLSFRDAYRMSAVAFFLGHLRWDHSHDYFHTEPLFLLR